MRRSARIVRQSIRTLCLFINFWIPLVSCWTLFGSRRTPPLLPRHPITSLVNHLTKDGSASRLSKGMEIIMLSPHECGVQYHPSSSSRRDEEVELAWIDREEFVTPALGEATLVGQALTTYLENHPVLRAVHHKVLPSIYLAIFLCLNKDQQGGAFDEYLLTLPSISAMQHFPIFWSQAALRELQGSKVRDAVLDRRRVWEEEFDIVNAALEAHSIPFDCNFGTWSWARSIITSRAFTDEASSQTMCLVPYVDMLNHCGSAEVPHLMDTGVKKGDWQVEEGGFRLTVHANDEGSMTAHQSATVEIAYGTLSNSQCLVNYGFAVYDDAHQTQHETAMISLMLDPSASSDTQRLWEKDGVEWTVTRNVTVSIGNPGSMETLLSLCRVACCQLPQELQDMTTQFVQRGEQTSQTDDGLVPQMAATLSRIPFSVLNEKRALVLLQQAASTQLACYKTTLSQDNHLLQHVNQPRLWWSPSDRNNHRNALIVRRGEKQVLHHFYNVASVCIDYLSQPSVDFEEYKEFLEWSLLSNDALEI